MKKIKFYHVGLVNIFLGEQGLMTRWPALAPYTVVSSRYIESVFKSPRNLRRWDGGGAGTMKKLRDGDQ